MASPLGARARARRGYYAGFPTCRRGCRSPVPATRRTPTPIVRRPGRAGGDLRVRTDHLSGGLRQVLVHLAPEELGGRALWPGCAPAQDVRQAPVAVELERLLAGPEAGDLLAHDGVGALLLLLDQADQAVERVAERYMSDEGREVSRVCQRGYRDAPPLIESPHQVFRRYADVIEEHLIELRLARDLSERPDGDARRLHVHEEEADGLVLGSFWTGPHEEEAPVGDVGHARPDLLAVDDEVAVVVHRAGLEVGEVRARVGLGEALAPELLCGQ